MVVLGAGIVIVGGLTLANQPDIVVHNERVVEEVLEVTPKPEDKIEKARLELERINAELDLKEQELLEERKAIDAELERLRETRMSFQSPREPKESLKR